MRVVGPGRHSGIFSEGKCSINIKYVIDTSMTLWWGAIEGKSLLQLHGSSSHHPFWYRKNKFSSSLKIMYFLGTSIQKSAWRPLHFGYNSLFVIIYTFLLEYLKCCWRWDEQQLKVNEINMVIYAGNQATFFKASFLNFQALGLFFFLFSTR